MNLIIIPNLIKLISKSGMNQIKLGMMMNGMGLTRRERGTAIRAWNELHFRIKSNWVIRKHSEEDADPTEGESGVGEG